VCYVGRKLRIEPNDKLCTWSHAVSDKKTLCELEKMGLLQADFEAYKELVRKGKYVCRRCGRAARKKKLLCRPEKL
jgi:hypothetical protein